MSKTNCCNCGAALDIFAPKCEFCGTKNINMTDIITNIKDLYVKAEDNRLIDNIKGFEDYFRKIDVQNAQLLDEFEKRSEK